MADSIAFRLEGAVREKLEEDAQARGMSPGQYARQIVIGVLEGQGPSQQELAGVRADLRRLREEWAGGGPAARSDSPGSGELAAIRDQLLAALQNLPKELGLDAHLVRFMAEYGSAQRELFDKNFAGLRRDLANAVLALLVGAGKMTNDEANAWVNAHLRRKD